MRTMRLLSLYVYTFWVLRCYGGNLHNQIRRTVSNPLWNETSVDKLRNDLLLNYDKFAKSDAGQITDVEIGLAIVYLETDELNSTFTASIWLQLSWKDPKLIWNSRDYNGIESLKMADHEIWQPDIYLFNSATTGGDPIIRYGNPHAIVYQSGVVEWVPPIKLTALCEFDMYYWPFDTQNCYLRFGSSTRSRNDLRLISKGVDVSTTLAITISTWAIDCTGTIIEVARAGYPEEFYHALYNITLTRKQSATTTIALAVICCASFLVLAQRLFVSRTGRGLILPCLTSIVLCIFLIHFGTKVAPKRSTAPWIVSFLSTCTVLHCITVIQTVVTVYAFKFRDANQIPWWAKRWLGGRLGRILLLSDCIIQCENCIPTRNFERNEDIKVSQCSSGHDLELCATAVDRLMFAIYFFIVTIFILTYVF